MKRIHTGVFLIMAFLASARGDEMATFFLKSGKAREAIFLQMKNDVVYVRIPKPDGSSVSKDFSKEMFERIVFADGRTLNLASSNSPVELNHRDFAKTRANTAEQPTEQREDAFETYQVEIAVSELHPKGIRPSEASMLTDVLRTELVKTGRYQVMERGQMSEILKEQGFQQSGACDESACIVRMGQFLGVSRMVVGNVGYMGSTYSINVRLVDVATGKILKDVSELHRGNKDKLLSHVMPGVAARLAGMKRRRSGKSVWITTGALGAAAAVGAAAYLYLDTRDVPEEETTDMKVKW